MQHFFNLNQAQLSEILDSEAAKSCDNLIQKVAKQMGEFAQKIWEDIKKYKQDKKFIQKYSFPTLQYQVQVTESNVCAKILKKGTKAFKCHDCMFESNSVTCVQCFEESVHKGHIYELIQVSGGCCDCGDQEKWDINGSCKKHSNKTILQDIKKRVNAKNEQSFIQQLSFCFVYWFFMYNQVELYEKSGKNIQNTQFKDIVVMADQYGRALMHYLNEFNLNSLISNLMTFNLLSSKLSILQKYPLQFCQKAHELQIHEVIFKMIKLPKCPQFIVNLFTQLFTIRQFRKKLTITFLRLHNESAQFAMSEFNHLSCQLLTSHKVIKQLVQNEEMQPLKYTPEENQIKNFHDLAQNFVRYYIDIEYLSRLYKQSSQIYLNYHIQKGCLPSLGYYRKVSYNFQQAINYYGIQEIYVSKLAKILKVVQNSPQCMQVLEKGMQDLFKQISRIYDQHNTQLFDLANQEQNNSEFAYLTQQISLGMLIFIYFEKLEQQDEIYRVEHNKIKRLVKVLVKQDDSGLFKDRVLQIIQVLNNSFILSGLCLGHAQTMERFYTYFSFIFRKSLTILSLTMYLYKIFVKIYSHLSGQIDPVEKQKSTIKCLSQCQIFRRPLAIVQKMFDQDQFQDDDESIFDRKKKMTRLSYFLNLIIQTAQTDYHQLQLAMLLDYNKKQKYEKMLNRFYIQLLKNYQKIALKDFKQIVDSFFVNDQAFQKLLSHSKQIVIRSGKISWKGYDQTNMRKLSGQDPLAEGDIIQSDMNMFYFKAFRSKLVNIDSKYVVIKTPQSSNHFLSQIISVNFINKVCSVVNAYFVMMDIHQSPKIKQRQTAGLGHLILELIKISEALKNTQKAQITVIITNLLKSIQNKKETFEIFTDDVKKIITHHTKQVESFSMIQKANKQNETQLESRRKKLEQKKSKKLAKFKQNQQKYEEAYSAELKDIRQEIQEENEIQDSLKQSKSCIICKQNHPDENNLTSELMVMGFVQLSDLYHHFFKGKYHFENNCKLVFKTCGHYIHQTCYNKINQNKDYTVCQLCKSSVNCLFPVCVSYYDEKLTQNDLNEESIQLNETQIVFKHICLQLSTTYSLMFAMDYSLRQNCENGFGESIQNQDQMKYKFIDSLVSQVVFSAIVSTAEISSFFMKKQLQIYQNILKGLKIFVKEQVKEIQSKNELNLLIKIKQDSRQTQLNKIHKQIQHERQKVQKQLDEKKKKIKKTVHFMENYVKYWVFNYIYGQNVQAKQETQNLSLQSIQKLQHVLCNVAGTMNSIQCKNESIQQQKQSQERMDLQNLQSVQKKQESMSKSGLQIPILREQFTLFKPPVQLQQLFKIRGKCDNCQLMTNHIFICFICNWRGCRECQEQSVSQHTNKSHNGHSIYIEADLGNIYFVSRKKIWVYESIYEDYLGQSLRQFRPGMKLDRYKLNQQRLQKIKKNFLDYDIQTAIRYEQFSRKRQFPNTL